MTGRSIHVRLLLAPLLVAACSSPKPPPATSQAPGPSVRNYPAPLYAGLFVKGAQHTYTVEARQSYGDEPEQTSTGSMTCTVTEVHELPAAVASRIECLGDVPVVGDSPGGVYVATAEGLWAVPDIPRVAPTTAKHRLFAWPLVASELDEPDPANPGWGSRIVISQTGAGWCRDLTFISGDDGDARICVAGGIITSGAASSSGGSTYEMSYELAKP